MQNDVLSRVLGALLIALGVLAYLDMLVIVALWHWQLGITAGDATSAELFGSTPETWHLVDTSLFVLCLGIGTAISPLIGLWLWPQRGGR
jgi:hypothetical protein